MKRILLALISGCLVVACSKDDTADPGPAQQGEYNIYMTGDTTGTFENGSVTLWNPGPNGDIISLGPEEAGQGADPDEPTVHLTIIFFNDGKNGNQQDIAQVTLRTKEEAQGSFTHQYEFEGEMNPSGCTGISGLQIEGSGSDFIKGSFCFELELFVSGDETITVHGDFTAISPF